MHFRSMISLLCLPLVFIGCSHRPHSSNSQFNEVEISLSSSGNDAITVEVRNHSSGTISLGREPFRATRVFPHANGRVLEIQEYDATPQIRTPEELVAPGAIAQARIWLPTLRSPLPTPDFWCFVVFPRRNGEIFEMNACVRAEPHGSSK